MSAVKRLAWGCILCAVASEVAHADPISWPAGLDNWVIYLAPSSNATGAAPMAPISYSVPAVIPAATQPAPPPPPPPVQPAPVQPAPALPAPVQPLAPPPSAVIASVPLSLPAAMPAPALAAAPAMSAPGPVDAFVNLGAGPYVQASAITTGTPLPWYDSARVTSFFGGQPSAQQIQSFDNTILQRVQQTFNQAGVSVSLTTNPAVPALHSLSLVSSTASASLANAIGMTQVGKNGFSFIDQIAPSAQSLDQLQWIVAHNISHELMLAFGVPENFDKSGAFIDSRVASWAMMVNPSSTFSPAAAQAIAAALAQQSSTGSGFTLGAQLVNSAAAVPEPSTWALWGLASAALVLTRRTRSLRSRDLRAV